MAGNMFVFIVASFVKITVKHGDC